MADQEVLRMTEGGLFIDMILTLKNEKKKKSVFYSGRRKFR